MLDFPKGFRWVNANGVDTLQDPEMNVWGQVDHFGWEAYDKPGADRVVVAHGGHDNAFGTQKRVKLGKYAVEAACPALAGLVHATTWYVELYENGKPCGRGTYVDVKPGTPEKQSES